MEDLEIMVEKERIAQIQLPDPVDIDPYPWLFLEGRASMPGSGSLRCSRMAGMILHWKQEWSQLARAAGTSLYLALGMFARWDYL